MGQLEDLRTEARPFDWERLTAHQVDAVKNVAAFLTEDLAEADRAADDGASLLDLRRKSRLAFIDGDRGTGKTSVLLTIQRILELDRLPRLENDRYPDQILNLHDNKSRFKCLETLDMEPLAKSANLLAAVFAQVINVFEYTARRDAGRLSSPLDDLDEHERLADELRRLSQSAVLAWDATNPRRALHVDPTVFASEVLTSETAGIELNRKFTEVLDKLAKSLSTKGKKNPIFILPVDDFDLSPTRCLELLRIVRMVSTPRLFFVIAGNTRIAERILRFECEGELAGLAGAFASGPEVEHIRGTAVEIAANNIRKLLPPQQRLRLAVLTADQALALKLQDGSSIENELEQVEIGVNFRAGARPKITLKEHLRPPEGYSGAAWLEGTPRQVVDHAALLRQRHGEHSNYGNRIEDLDQFLKAMAEDLANRLREDGHILPETRETLLDALTTTASVQFQLSRGLKIRTVIGNQRTATSGDLTITCRYPREHRWMIRTPMKREEETPGIEIPRAASGNLTFFHDLAISLWGGYVSGSIIYSSEWLYDPVTVQSRGRERALSWHLPEWWALREYERFTRRWETYSSERVSESVDDHILAWLRASLEVLLDVPRDETLVTSVAGVRQLLDQLAEESNGRFAREYLRNSALVNAALVLCPEAGCSVSLAKDLTSKNGFLEKMGEELWQRVRAKRARDFAANRYGGQRETLDAPSVGPLASISPTAAESIVWERNPRTVPSLKSDIAQARLAVLLADMGEPDATDLVSKLEELGSLLRNEEDDRFRNWIELMLRAKKTPARQHPINRFRDARLVPTLSEIDRSDRSSVRLP